MPITDEPDTPAPECETGNVSRRSFIQTLGLSAAAGAISGRAEAALARQDKPGEKRADAPTIYGPEPIKITLTINGADKELTIDPATTLMEALRWHVRLTGTKEVCDRGSCGACSVLVDGKLINSCMMLAVDAIGAKIMTVEGLAQGDKLDPIQEAFVRHDALQCGFCTPGLVLACKALLNQNPKPTLDEIKHGLSGNICRCGTYTNVFNATLEASGQQPIIDGGARA